MRDAECVAFLQWALPRLRMRWPAFRRVRRQVCRRLARRLAALELCDLEAYRRRLEQDPDEWLVLEACCRITISRFCRDRGVFDSLGRQVLPALAREACARAQPALHAWSAGCGSGEEVYSLRALWELEVAPHQPGLELRVLGTDADATCLARARRGCYAGSSLRELPAGWRERVFEALPASPTDRQAWRVRKPFRAGIELRLEDLRRAMPTGPFDLVLCRNLAFTYFDLALQREVLDGILQRLLPGGALVIGLHEALPKADPLPAPPGLVPWRGARAVYRYEPDATPDAGEP